MSHLLASSIFWAAVGLCAIAQFAILRSALRATRTARATGAAAHRSSPAAELLWVLLPALMLAGALLLTWRALDARAKDRTSGHAARSPQHAASPDSDSKP